MNVRAVVLDGIELPPASELARGADIVQAVLNMAERAIDRLRRQSSAPIATVGRLRGTGRGVHFRDLIRRLESEHPITLAAPFEDSELVAGAAWDASNVQGLTSAGALAKLRWSAGADDLPMHVHEHSDRFIIVEEGRGFFHVSDQTIDAFDGSEVRSIPARERDVFVFTRGVVHTFSTLDEPMTLLSCQMPYLAFDDPRQYRLPSFRWTARDQPERYTPTVACDPAWSVLARH
ncbi:MAG: cupin domain-containing protein [Phycisphaerales bacterium]|jgi:mannose-6-phosphate isomerase-like protein (cupin superfamily)|nr:cupin domain-containing protein [Phycisphaerales bacterium]